MRQERGVFHSLPVHPQKRRMGGGGGEVQDNEEAKEGE